MDKKIIAITFVLFTILVIIFAINSINIKSVEKNPDYYSWTKAVCDETSCQDYIIECRGKNVVRQTPITGAVIQKYENWTDPRNETEQNKICGD
jgi:hypothetical protein